MNEKKNSLIATVPVVKDLRKVPGFDPLKHLRTVSKDGEKVLKLDLRFKKLWFRLACPQGRMLLNPLRITDQMAIFEARVYASKDDATPLANFTSTQEARNVPGGLYIRAAQDEALNEALDNAGFGIQLCDVAQVSDCSGFGSEIPLAQVEAARQAASGEKAVLEPPAETPKAADTPVEAVDAEAAPLPLQAEAQCDDPAPPQNPPAAPVEETVEEVSAPQETAPQETVEEPVEPAPVMEEPAPQEEAPDAAIPQSQGQDNVTPLPVAPAPEEGAPAEPAVPAEAPLPTDNTAVQNGYTEDMTIEEICERMTLDEARDILVPLGTCKGWTLGQVLDRRAASLRWYMIGCQEASNVLKAGATLLWNTRLEKQAG